MSRVILAVDIGGTNIKYAAWRDGKLDEVKEIPTPQDSLQSLMAALKNITKSVPEVEGVALSMPGFIDVEKGIAKTGGALEYIKDTKIVDILESYLNLPVSVENDAKAAAKAELNEGCLRGIKNAVMLVFGTGVGGAIIANGSILKGEHLLSGEFSYVSADINEMGEFASSVGSLCGAVGLAECVEKTSGLTNLTGRQIFEEINKGNKEALEGLKLFCSHIVWLLYNLEVIVDPEVFAIGGGISQQPILITTIKEEIKKVAQDPVYQRLPEPQVTVCHFTAHANLVGAIQNFLELYTS